MLLNDINCNNTFKLYFNKKQITYDKRSQTILVSYQAYLFSN